MIKKYIMGLDTSALYKNKGRYEEAELLKK